jgi:hypothetical protein
LNANTWSNNLNTTNGVWDPTPLDWRNSHEYSVSYGGPIFKNKTFFFALWDQQITNSRELQSPTVLTDTARLGIFRYWQGWNPTNYLADEEALNFPVAATTATVRSVNDAGLPVAPARWPDGTPYTGSFGASACSATCAWTIRAGSSRSPMPTAASAASSDRR